jgi:hypothetical protein
MPILATLNQHYPGEVIVPQNVAGIPSNQYFVYILALNDAAIVVGHGRRNRARVIFDGLGQTTVHFKAILVRLHHLYAPPGAIFTRYLIKCASKVEATQREHALHALIGGNVPQVPEEMDDKLFDGVDVGSLPWVLLKVAQASSYDGLSDLNKWRNLGIIDDPSWATIRGKLGEFQ